MSDARWQRIRALFEAASELPAKDRLAFLERECAGDPDLRAEVERLLGAESEADSDWFEPPHTKPANPDPEAAPPERLGEFEILEEIGRGGMGVVYRASQRSFDRDVAIKVLHRTPATPQSVIDRFHREARIIARVRHPNIVEVYVEGHTDHLDWFAMEYVDGGDLRSEITALRATRDAVSSAAPPQPEDVGHIRRAAELSRDVARALHTAHQRGVVHRDVKPGNLLLTHGTVKVADFGIARHEGFGNLTKAGEVAGSVAYMSPEQARLTAIELDHRTDIYSLGVVLYELLTLVQPFAGPTDHETRDQILRARPTSPRAINREIPRDLETICMKAMERDPTDRYPDAAALADDLQRFLDHRAILARPPTFRRRALNVVRRQARWLIAAAAILVAVWIGGSVAEARARSAAVTAQLGVLRAISPRATGEWERMSPADLHAAHAATERLRAMQNDMATSDLAELERCANELRAYRSELEDRGRGLLTAGRAVRPDPNNSEANARTILEGWSLLLRSYAIFNDERSIAGYGGDPVAPALTVTARRHTGEILSGRVGYRRIDYVTGRPGPEIALGPLPLRDHLVEEGYFRIVVHLDGIGAREFSRHLVAGYREHTIECVWRPEQAEVELASIPAGTMRLQDEDPFLPPLDRTPIAVPAFRLARHEVTVAQWRAYTNARQRAGLPVRKHWMLERIPPGSPLEQLPIVHVGWLEAREFAEWYGCRLPTFVEYSWAARGPTGRDEPWLWGQTRAERPSPAPAAWFGNVHGRRPTATEQADENGFYLTQLRPVGSDPRAATPAPMGVHDLVGNVREWLESPCPSPDKNGGLVVRPTQKIAVGGHWVIGNEPRWKAPFPSPRGIEQAWDAYDCGFRIAASKTP